MEPTAEQFDVVAAVLIEACDFKAGMLDDEIVEAVAMFIEECGDRAPLTMVPKLHLVNVAYSAMAYYKTEEER